MKKNNKGFTLAELLIVVAIIAVLVAVAIPVFTTQLHKSKAATDKANCRSLYADLQSAFLADNDTTRGFSATDSFTMSDGQTIKLKAGTVAATASANGYKVEYVDTVDGCGSESWGADAPSGS